MAYWIYYKNSDQTLTSIKDEIVGLIDKAIADNKKGYEEGWIFRELSLKSWNDMYNVGVDGLLVNIAFNLVHLKKPKCYKDFCEMCDKEIAFLVDCGCDKEFVSQIPEIIWNVRVDPKHRFNKHQKYDKLKTFGQLFHRSLPLSYRIMSSDILGIICIIATILMWINGFASSREGHYCICFSAFAIIVPICLLLVLDVEKKYIAAFTPLAMIISFLLILILVIFFLSWWKSDWFIMNHRIYNEVIYYDLNLYDLRKTITLLLIPLLFSPVYYYNEDKAQRSHISSLFTTIEIRNI